MCRCPIYTFTYDYILSGLQIICNFFSNKKKENCNLSNVYVYITALQALLNTYTSLSLSVALFKLQQQAPTLIYSILCYFVLNLYSRERLCLQSLNKKEKNNNNKRQKKTERKIKILKCCHE